MEPLLRIEGVSKRFGGLQALRFVDLEVREGEILSLIGPNGAGKTTLFNCLTGLVRPDRGAITLRGEGDLRGLTPHGIARRGIARTFQNLRLFGAMTVLENVLMGAYCREGLSLVGSILQGARYRAAERKLTREVGRVLDQVGLAPRASEPARNLPYGGQRRLEIARALATRPRLLLLDEPAAGMNPQETRELGRLVREIRERGVTIFLIEHDMRVVMEISDRVAVLDYGEKVAEGPPAAVRVDPRVVEAYLGKPR